jgi:hypothetical protein
MTDPTIKRIREQEMGERRELLQREEQAQPDCESGLRIAARECE